MNISGLVSSTSSTASAHRVLSGNDSQEVWNLLVGLAQDLNKILHNILVTSVDECSSNTSVSCSSSSTNTVNVVVNVIWQIVIDDVGHVWNVQTSGSNSSGNQNRRSSASEALQSSLSLVLGSVTVNRGSREVLVDQEVRQDVSHLLGFDENQSQSVGHSFFSSCEDIKQTRLLFVIFNVENSLSDVLGSRSNSTHRQEDIVVQKVLGHHLNFLREGGREHQCLSFSWRWHVTTLDDVSDLDLESHVQHSVGLIENKIFDVFERYFASLQKIVQSSWSGD
ncbi:hypothetical protein OGAPHI_005693 [Ogataea philodendri]|uniref:Uncharacterized protein n=1 Tax=Ogataea philodendri TaxID=1378263 RepID=A0A9P8P041_9ASCO|nr:uncharacterized protein OGAPHI_005693 [Ogataea philodendri]KAH3662441.1 hypothetical protein OGAPHI_005693 [Ogataea philodendri]